MARVPEWTDLGELGNTTNWSIYGAAFFGLGGRSIVVAEPYLDAQGNGGLYALRFQQPNAGMVSPYKATGVVSTFYWRAHFRTSAVSYASLPSGGRIFTWRKDLTELGYLWINNSGALNIQIGGSTIATTVPGLILSNIYACIELKIVIADSGSYELRVNGIPRASGTADTKPGADTGINNWVVEMNSSAGGEIYHWFDDVVVDTANWPGEAVITAVKPNEAGGTTELTPEPSTADNWQNVDEIPPSDVDYNYTTVVNKKDTYVHESLPGAASSIKAVTSVARVARSGVDITNAYLVTGSGGTDYESAAIPVGTVPTIITKVEEVDPDTGLPWVVGDYNLTEMGIRFDT